MGRQHTVIWRKGASARSEVRYLPQVISRMRWRRNKPADKETRSTNKLRLLGGDSTLFVKGHSFEGWTQYEVKCGAELEGLAGITMWLVWCWLCKKSSSSARGYRLTSKHASYVFSPSIRVTFRLLVHNDVVREQYIYNEICSFYISLISKFGKTENLPLPYSEK